jgi:hypothetical protein
MLFLIPLVCAIVFGSIFVFATEASGFAKLLVAVLVIASLVIKFFLPGLWLAAVIIQVIVSIGILLYLKVN